MDEQEIYAKLKELDKIISPEECNLISSYISGYLQDYEERLHVKNLELSNLWLQIRPTQKSDNRTDRVLEATPLYQEVERIKLSMSQLKRMRGDLRSRFEVLTRKFNSWS